MAAIVNGPLELPDPASWDALVAGKVRAQTDDWQVQHLRIDHHSAAQEAADRIEAQAEHLFTVEEACLVHRVGEIPCGELIVLSLARGDFEDSLQASRWMLEKIKVRLPAWKQERGPEGTRWIGGKRLRGYPGEPDA